MALPSKVKIGDKEVELKDHPELLELIQQVRTEEKEKLYSEKAKLEAKVNELKNKVAEGETLSAAEKAELEKLKGDIAKKDGEIAATKAALEEAKKGKGKKKKADDEGEDDEDAPLTKKEMLKAMEELLKPLKDELKGEVKKVEGELTKKALEDYRAELLEKNKGLIIPDLLQGSTKAELDANLVKVLETSKPYITKEVKGKDGKIEKVTLAELEQRKADEEAAIEKLKERNKNRTGGKDDAGADAPERDTQKDPKTLLKDVSKMDAKEYAKHREQIKKELFAGGGSEEDDDSE